jgi:hypothetical protein
MLMRLLHDFLGDFPLEAITEPSGTTVALFLHQIDRPDPSRREERRHDHDDVGSNHAARGTLSFKRGLGEAKVTVLQVQRTPCHS